MDFFGNLKVKKTKMSKKGTKNDEMSIRKITVKFVGDENQIYSQTSKRKAPPAFIAGSACSKKAG